MDQSQNNTNNPTVAPTSNTRITDVPDLSYGGESAQILDDSLSSTEISNFDLEQSTKDFNELSSKYHDLYKDLSEATGENIPFADPNSIEMPSVSVDSVQTQEQILDVKADNSNLNSQLNSLEPVPDTSAEPLKEVPMTPVVETPAMETTPIETPAVNTSTNDFAPLSSNTVDVAPPAPTENTAPVMPAAPAWQPQVPPAENLQAPASETPAPVMPWQQNPTGQI